MSYRGLSSSRYNGMAMSRVLEARVTCEENELPYARVYTEVLHFHFHPSHKNSTITDYQTIKYTGFDSYTKHSVKGTWRTRVSDRGTHVSDKGTHIVAYRQISDRFLRKYKRAKTVQTASYRFFQQSKQRAQCLQQSCTHLDVNDTSATRTFRRLKGG